MAKPPSGKSKRSYVPVLIVVGALCMFTLVSLAFQQQNKGCNPVTNVTLGDRVTAATTGGSAADLAARLRATASSTASPVDGGAAEEAGSKQSASSDASAAATEQKTDAASRIHYGAVRFKVPAELGLPSDAWRPQIFSACAPGMPTGYAPCLNYSNLLQGEELVYPDYRIRLPRSINQAHHNTLIGFLKPRFRKDEEWAYYLNQHGRNLVFENTTYDNDPVPHWSSSCCMCEGFPAPHKQFVGAKQVGAQAHASVMFVASPDSNSFQHWRDRVAMMLIQARHLIDNTTKFIVSPPRDRTVADQWRLIANATSKDLLKPEAVSANKFIYSCDTPLLHPYLVQRMSEVMLESAGLDPKGKPWDERKVVLLIGRNKDSGVHNSHERHWLNYDECKPQIEALLERRGQGERLEEWDLSRFNSLEEIMRYWNHNVRGALGVHGSGLMNVHWASPRAVIFEIWPVTEDGKKTRGLNVFWEQATLKGADYWWFHAPSDNKWNVNVDCGLLVQALDKGLTPDYSSVLEPFYQGTNWSTR